MMRNKYNKRKNITESKTMNRCAIFLDADPLSKKEIEAIKHVAKLYELVDIFLERKSYTHKSQLSYDEKVDIFKHDLPYNVCNYMIHPIDTSKCDALLKEGITNIAMIMSAGSDMKYINDQIAMYYQLIKNCSVILVPVKQKDDILPKHLQQLILDDISKNVCKKFISDYAYFKTKFKLIKKLAIQRSFQYKSCISRVFEDRSDCFELLNIDSLTIEEAYKRLADIIMDTNKKCIAVCSNNFTGLDISKLADIYIEQNNKKDTKNIGIKLEGSDDISVSRNLIGLLNGKLKKLGSIEIF